MEPTAIGALIGAVIGLVVAFFLVKGLHTNKKLRPENDERIKAHKNKGYAIAFAVTCGWMVLFSVFETFNFFPLDYSSTLLYGPIIGILVGSCYMISHDSYFGMNEKYGTWMKTLIILAAINLVFGIAMQFMPYAPHFVQNGQVYFMGSMNLVVGIWITIITIYAAIHHNRTEKEADAE